MGAVARPRFRDAPPKSSAPRGVPPPDTVRPARLLAARVGADRDSIWAAAGGADAGALGVDSAGEKLKGVKGADGVAASEEPAGRPARVEGWRPRRHGAD